MGRKPGKKDEAWREAKRRCRLYDEEVRMAKELGLNPRSLIKNIPAKSQPWKAPENEWIRGLYAKRFGESHRPGTVRNPERPPSQPAKLSSPRTPGLICEPKGRITIETMADVSRRIEGMDQVAKALLCDELAASQPEALGWVLALHRQGVSMPVVDEVLHILLVISQSIRKTVPGPAPRIALDDFEKAAGRVRAMFRLLHGETAEGAAWLTYLMAEAHPERNLFAYVADRLSKSKADQHPGDQRAIFATAVLLDVFLGASGLAPKPGEER